MRKAAHGDRIPRPRARLTDPLNIRLPTELRGQLRKFAASRQLTEAAAIRSMLKDHLEELPVLDDIERARRWQVEQVWEDARQAVAGGGAEGEWRDVLASHRVAMSEASARRGRGGRKGVAG